MLWRCLVASRRLLDLFIIFLIMFLLAACEQEAAKTTRQVRLGIADQPSSALMFVALANNYFKDEALEVEVHHFPSGKRALIDGFDQGKLDYFATAEVPFVGRSFSDPQLITIAALYTADNVNRIVARRDHGITRMQDLLGKKIATQEKSAVHYFLHLVLDTFEIKHDRVSIAFTKAENLPEQLASGEIDAFSMRDPFVSQAVELLGDNAIVFEAKGIYVQSELLITSKTVFDADPDIADRLLRALVRAEEYALNNRQQAIHITAQTLKIEDQQIEKIWNSLNLEVSMHQSMLVQFERVADWLSKEVFLNQPIPYFLDHLEASSLKRVSAERVSLVKQ